MATHQADQLEPTIRSTMAQAPSGPSSMAGRFAGLRVTGGHSVVSVDLHGRPGGQVTLAATPDARLARTLTSGFRRLAWIRIDASSPDVRCEVSGIARRPRRCRLPLAAALALAEADVPTLVRLRRVGS